MQATRFKILTFFLLFCCFYGLSQEIWYEGFAVPDKGVWGDEDGTSINSDFDGITQWSLDYSKVAFVNSGDYAKTVSTSGGRFECKDTNGEVIWRSEKIDISDYKNISIELIAKETGSGAKVNKKYLKAYFILDEGNEQLLETNGESLGNWGKNVAEQKDLDGTHLQIVVYMNSYYSADKVILDEIVVKGEEKNPIEVEIGDVLLNEILFNPVPGGEDFVEIYNHSNKAIPLNKLYLASRDKNLELTQIYPLSSSKRSIQLQSYLALTKDTNGVFPWFTIACPECFLQIEKIPSFNNKEDHVVLLNNKMEVIDELFYDEKMHAPLLYDREGISLERTSFTVETNVRKNWHSASTTSGYGTPGYENSQLENEAAENIDVKFSPEAFSPNNDGYNDQYSISFLLDKPGYMANVWIFDSSGQLITQLCKNIILGTTTQVVWDGTDKTGQRQRLGVYVVLVEVFSSDGLMKQFKDGVVLTNVLN